MLSVLPFSIKVYELFTPGVGDFFLFSPPFGSLDVAVGVQQSLCTAKRRICFLLCHLKSYINKTSTCLLTSTQNSVAMHLPSLPQLKIKNYIHGFQGFFIFLVWALTIAVFTKPGNTDGRSKYVFALVSFVESFINLSSS